MHHAEMLIAGHFVGGPCDQSVSKSVMRNPWDGSIVGTAAEGGANEAEAAIGAAAEAWPSYRRTTSDERRQLLLRIASLVRERREELALLLVDEIGKPVTWALAEVDRMAVTFDLSARAVDLLGPFAQDLSYDKRGADYSGTWRRMPVGPTLCILPWNWPFNLGAHKLGPALAVGNTIVLKPSGLSPISSLTLARLIHEAGCPPGVLNAINVPGRIAEKATQDPRVKKVSFTGSPAVGWHLKELLPRKQVTLELGGDASVIVMDDADLEWAAERTVLSSNGYAGQVCISAQHAWVTSSIYEAFMQILIDKTKHCPTGDPRDPKTVCGPLINAEAADKVMDWIHEGGKVLAGGIREGNVVRPTLIEDAPPDSRLATQEVFGPAMTLSKVKDLDEAIGKVNASNYGIHASIFTKDEVAIRKAEAELEVAGVVANDYPTLRFDGLPYGGVKESGFGREGVEFTVEEMTEPKSLVRRI